MANQTIPIRRNRLLQSHPLVEALEQRQLLSAEFTGSFAGALPSALPPGGISHATVRVSDRPGQLETGAVTVTLYLSDDPSVDSSALVLGTATRQVHLRGGQAVAFPFRFASPPSVSTGNDYLLAQIDGPTNTDGSANQTVVAAPGMVAVSQPTVDLIGRIVAFPATLLVNSKCPTAACAQVQVYNTGSVTARGTLQITMYASTDGAIDSNATVIGTNSFKAAAIRAGGSRMFAAKMSIPAGMNPGSYTLLALINPSNTIAETNTANNIAVGQHPLKLLSAPPGNCLGNHQRNNGDNGSDGGDGSEVDVEVDTGTDDGCDEGSSDTSNDSAGGTASSQPSSGDDSDGSDASGSDFGDPSPVDPNAGSDF